MPIIDVNKMKSEEKERLLTLYDEKICNLKALPEEFANAETRRVINEALCEALSLRLKLDALYELLSKESMLRGK